MYDIEDYNQKQTDDYIADKFEKHVVEREMYVVNLSKMRIAIFVSILVVLISSTFLGGILVGSKMTNKNAGGVASEGGGTATQNESISYAYNDTQETEKNVYYLDAEDAKENNTDERDYSTPSLLDELEAGEKIVEKRLAEDLNSLEQAGRKEVQTESALESVEVAETKTTSTATKADPNKIYFIQVAISSDKERSEREKLYLKKRFPRTFLVEDKLNGTKVYKIKVGRYYDYEDAKRVLQKIKQIPTYSDSYIYSDKANS